MKHVNVGRTKKGLIWIAFLALTHSGCGLVSQEDYLSADDNEGSIAETMSVEASRVIDAASNGTGVASLEIVPVRHSTPSDWLREKLYPSQALAATCGIDRFDPPIGSESCAGTEDDKTVLSVFDDCTGRGRGLVTVSGTVKLSFDEPAACDEWINGGDLPTSGSVTRTSDDFTKTFPNGAYLTKTSEEHTNYNEETISGGVQTSFLENQQRSIDILGVHRQGFNKKGEKRRDQSVTTPTPLLIEGFRHQGNLTIYEGVIQVDLNLAKFSAQADLTGLNWDSDCCHPKTGEIEVSYIGKDGGFTMNFSTGSCDTVEITSADGSTREKELRACR